MPGRIHARIGEILRDHGQLTDEQIAFILDQQQHNHYPFGELAQRHCGVTTTAVERAWTQQYLGYGTLVDLAKEKINPAVMKAFTRRQAWQFRLLPLRCEDGRMVVVTTAHRLPRAAAFAWRRLSGPVFFLVADADQVDQFLQRFYPWPAMGGGGKSVKTQPGKPLSAGNIQVVVRDPRLAKRPVVVE